MIPTAPPTIYSVRLRDYQASDINRIDQALARLGAGGGVGYALPTGGGKTIIYAQLAALALERGRRVLILEHRRELVRQTVAKLEAIGLSPAIIAAGIANPNEGAALAVGMIQTIHRRDLSPWAPDLVIVDEAHRAKARTWCETIRRWPMASRLLVSATFERLDGRGFDDLVAELIHGPCVNELIAKGWLVASDTYSIPGVDLRGLRTRAGEFEAGEMAARFDRAELVGSVVGEYRRLAWGKTGIVFASSVAHSKRIAASFCADGVAAEHLDGTTPSAERAAILDRLARGTTRIVSSVAVLTEGFDCPSIGYIALARCTASRVLWLQCCGRGLRSAPGKSLCIIVDHGGNALRHGLADTSIRWTLEGRPRNASAPALALRTCAECFAVLAAALARCPRCGAARPPVDRADPRLVAGRLVRVTKADIERRRRDESRQVAERPPPSWADPATWQRVEAKRKREGYKLGYTAGVVRAIMRRRRIWSTWNSTR